MPISVLAKAALFVSVSACCVASTVYLDSGAHETTNNSGSATVNITPNSGWSNALAGSNWVSFTDSGDPCDKGFVHVPNGTSVLFSDTFQLSGTPLSGDLIVMADDTTSVTLNGVTLMSEAPTAGNNYSHCSNLGIGCTTATEGKIDLTSALRSGINVLTFDVLQVAGGSYGLDYSAVVQASPATAATPEPSTLLLFALPLVLLGILRKKLKGSTVEDTTQG